MDTAHIRRQDTAELVELSSPSEEVLVYRAVFGVLFYPRVSGAVFPDLCGTPFVPQVPLLNLEVVALRRSFRSTFLELKILMKMVGYHEMDIIEY